MMKIKGKTLAKEQVEKHGKEENRV